VRESQKVESQSCRLPKARTPRESKQNRSSRIRSTRWSVRAASYPLPDLSLSLLSPLSLSFSLSLSVSLFPSPRQPRSLKHLSASIQRFWKYGGQNGGFEYSIRSVACRKSIFHVIIRIVREGNLPQPFQRRRRYLEIRRARRILIVATTILLHNGKTFTDREKKRERERERQRGRETIFARRVSKYQRYDGCSSN